MEAHPRRLKSVFRSDLRLVVPLFQRPYVWDEEDQWAPLWEDILAAFDRRTDVDTPPHFLGAIVLEQKRGALGSLEVREVIDGQQRLTTLQLFIAALRDTYLAENIKTRLFNHLRKTLENDTDLIERSEEEFKLYPTNRDRAPFVGVMRGEYRDKTSDPSYTQIPRAYLYFRGQLEDLVSACGSEQEVEDALDGLSEVALEHLELVVIDLDVEDNAQVIFETLNARGTALRASDLIKNALFRTLQDGAAGDDGIETLYRTYWEPLESEQWQTEVRVGRLTRPRLDVFVGYFLTVLLQREVQSHQLFPQARGYFDGDKEMAAIFLKEMSRYAAVYAGIDDRTIASKPERVSLDRLEIVDTTTIMPVLLWLFANSAGAERERALALLEAYLVRRAICRLTPKNYNRLFLELTRRLESATEEADVVVERFLVGQRSDSGAWPTDTQVVDDMTRLQLYRLVKRDRLQRLLLAIENEMTTDRTEPVPPSKKLSVEHLLPQAWHENWPVDPRGGGAEEERRDELVHTIGNLTLITQKLNASVSNGPWSIKHENLLKHSALTMNRSLPAVWGSDAIEQRSRVLADVATRMWSRPDEAPARELSDNERELRPDRDRAVAASKSSPRRTAGSGTRRRDIGQHIVSAFSELDSGEFLTIREISRTPSEQYPANDPPSDGAISIRLFPKDSRSSTVPGVEGVIVGGRRGARKL